MKYLLLVCVLLVGCGPQKAETPNWRGFKKDTLPDGWRHEDGVLTHIKGGGDIITENQYRDFVLELDWKISEGGNSGIFFHVSEDHDHVWLGGPEMQILDNEAHKDAMKPETSAGSNYALYAPCRDVTKPVGEWNHIKLVVNGNRHRFGKGPHVEHWMNGTKLLEYELWSDDWKARVAASKFKDMPPYGLGKTGHIALQDHGDIVSFQNISILTK